MVKVMDKKEVQRRLKHLRHGGFKVEGKEGWYKAFDGDVVVFTSMPHSNGMSMCTLNEEYYG
jgi:hypothetical protein